MIEIATTFLLIFMSSEENILLQGSTAEIELFLDFTTRVPFIQTEVEFVLQEGQLRAAWRWWPATNRRIATIYLRDLIIEQSINPLYYPNSTQEEPAHYSKLISSLAYKSTHSQIPLTSPSVNHSIDSSLSWPIPTMNKGQLISKIIHERPDTSNYQEYHFLISDDFPDYYQVFHLYEYHLLSPFSMMERLPPFQMKNSGLSWPIFIFQLSLLHWIYSQPNEQDHFE